MVGNPPWGSVKKEALAARWCEDSARVMPNRQIATAFVWKAIEHARAESAVCFVLPHGTLFNHGTKALKFQKAWFETHRVERVLNLTDLRRETTQRRFQQKHLPSSWASCRQRPSYTRRDVANPIAGHTDVDDPVLGFTSRWIQAVATKVKRIHVITMRAGRIELPENVRCDSVGKEAGYSRPRRIVEFYRILLEVLRNEPVDACFSHMFPLFTVLAAPLLRPKGVPIVTWYAHLSPSCPKTRTERQGRILEAFSKLAETSRRGTGSAIGEPEQTPPADHPFRPTGAPELLSYAASRW